ncbi:hypothetical protein D5S18_24795, partial [Nocardia panacis]
MNSTTNGLAEALRASLKDRERLHQEVARLREIAHEPIAIVGVGCRFPGGVRSAGDLWSVVSRGRDVISGFPGDRGW